MSDHERFPDKDLPYELQMRGFKTARPFFAKNVPPAEEVDAHLAKVDKLESDLATHLLGDTQFTDERRVENFEKHNTTADQSLAVLRVQGIVALEPKANAE